MNEVRSEFGVFRVRYAFGNKDMTVERKLQKREENITQNSRYGELTS
jgi:hypothetical protein